VRRGWQAEAGVRTGPMGLKSVSSNTFSIADFDGSRGAGLTSVGWSAMVEAEVEPRRFWDFCTRGVELVLEI
jgi:hypothetical protein